MNWQQKFFQGDQVVYSRDWLSGLLQQRLQVLFSRLLTMEADDVVHRLSFAIGELNDAKVGFGLSDPFPCQAIHKGFSPMT